VQLTQQELPHVACVLFGWVDLCEYKSHGPQKNKGFKLMIQEQNGKKGLFVNIMESGKPLCAVPVSAIAPLLFAEFGSWPTDEELAAIRKQ